MAIDHSGCVYTYRGDDGWLSDSGAFLDISTCRDGATCAVTADGQVSIDLGEAVGWYQLADGMRTVAIGSLSNIWCLDADGRSGTGGPCGKTPHQRRCAAVPPAGCC